MMAVRCGRTRHEGVGDKVDTDSPSACQDFAQLFDLLGLPLQHSSIRKHLHQNGKYQAEDTQASQAYKLTYGRVGMTEAGPIP